MNNPVAAKTTNKKRRWYMTILWIAMGIITIFVVIPIVIGLMLPERYEGKTTVFLDQSPEQVWVALQNYEAHPMTGKMTKSVTALPKTEWTDELPAWIEDMGRGELITVKTVEANHPNRLVRTMESQSMPMNSRWVYTLEPANDGCNITINGETTIRKGSWMVPVFRFMMVVGGGVKKGLDIQLNMVAKTLGVDIQHTPQ